MQQVLRTPDDRFANLPDFPFDPSYAEVGAGAGGTLRMHYLDEGAPDAEPVLLLHGEPTWCLTWRTTIPVLVEAGLRVVAPDLIGFGRSDKPAAVADYTYERHVGWTRGFLDAIDLRGATVVGQDWGGLIGLRLVAEDPGRFDRVVVSNHGLPTGDRPMPPAFMDWLRYSQEVPELPVGEIVRRGCLRELAPAVVAAYDAPYPDERYKAGARVFPVLVPIRPDDPAAAPNRRAWEALAAWRKPLLTAFSDSDPITAGADRRFQEVVPGARGQPHATIERAGHNLQEDSGPELAKVVADFIAATPRPGR
jgi:haloalkane dehalogenase